MLTKEHDDLLKRNLHLDKMLKETRVRLKKQQHLNIELDEYMREKIESTISNNRKEYQKNMEAAAELLEIITSMKNIYSTKKTKLLLYQNQQLKKSLDEAQQIIMAHETKN